MRKGLSGEDFVGVLLVFIFAAVAIAIVFFHWRLQLNAETILRQVEISDNRRITYAQILLSSDLLAFVDENGMHRGIINYTKVKALTPEKLFGAYSYQDDDLLSRAQLGYMHYIKIEALENEKGEPIKEAMEFEQEKIGFLESSYVRSPKIGAKDFPIAIRYPGGYVGLGKMYVNVIPYEFITQTSE
ncbi:MAG: hypothetical protein HY361_03710 [Candidatus Aenigmarchaeota archaeon]|nr:hypothetical protein [Candidatus Aenigmarchaeota archaeon]